MSILCLVIYILSGNLYIIPPWEERFPKSLIPLSLLVLSGVLLRWRGRGRWLSGGETLVNPPGCQLPSVTGGGSRSSLSSKASDVCYKPCLGNENIDRSGSNNASDDEINNPCPVGGWRCVSGDHNHHDIARRSVLVLGDQWVNTVTVTFYICSKSTTQLQRKGKCK